MYYFAYGSCMHKQDFNRTMVSLGKVLYHEVLGVARLENYRLAYNAYSESRHGGVLDVERCQGKYVIGILYKLSSEALLKVDKREGKKYKRIIVKVALGNQIIEAYTYVVDDKKVTKADIRYSGIVYHAMLDYKFPNEYVRDYIRLVRESVYGSEENYFIYKAKKEKEKYVK